MRGRVGGHRVAPVAAAVGSGPVGPVAPARPVGPHGGPPSPWRFVPILRRRGFRRRGSERSSIRRLAAVIETASNRQAWSASRIGLAGSRASLARASTSFARRSACSAPSSQPRAMAVSIILRPPCRSWASSSQSKGSLGPVGSVGPFPAVLDGLGPARAFARLRSAQSSSPPSRLPVSRAASRWRCSAVRLATKSARGSAVGSFADSASSVQRAVQRAEGLDVTSDRFSLATGRR